LTLVAAVLIESFAQVSLKIGAAGPGILSSPLRQLATRYRITTIDASWKGLGIFLYGMQIVLWTLVLHRFEVSVAYPMDSLCFVVVSLLSRILLGEVVDRWRWLGVFCILSGTILIAL
jgi:multidrug transporter EmrE-like cation transporter